MPGGGERFVAMEMSEANKQCGSRGQQHFVQCAKCTSRVAIHCDDCKIQVTGCTCTEVDRFGSNAEGIAAVYERMAKRVGPEAAQRQLQKAGFWIPKGVDLN